jgi:transcriptional regulator with XRE-family HTH domain
MKLEEYIKSHGLNLNKFAVKVGVSRVQITRLIKGQQNPSAHLTHKIMEITNGEVTFQDLFNPSAPSRLDVHRKKKKLIEKS